MKIGTKHRTCAYVYMPIADSVKYNILSWFANAKRMDINKETRKVWAFQTFHRLSWFANARKNGYKQRDSEGIRWTNPQQSGLAVLEWMNLDRETMKAWTDQI